MSYNEEQYDGWFRNTVQAVRKSSGTGIISLPGTDLKYRLDCADYKVTPLFTDPGEFMREHLLFRRAASHFPFPYPGSGEGNGFAVYLCEDEYPETKELLEA